MSLNHALPPENDYRKTALWVSVVHIVALVLVAFWALIFVTHPEPLVMMAEMGEEHLTAWI